MSSSSMDNCTVLQQEHSRESMREGRHSMLQTTISRIDFQNMNFDVAFWCLICKIQTRMEATKQQLRKTHKFRTVTFVMPRILGNSFSKCKPRVNLWDAWETKSPYKSWKCLLPYMIHVWWFGCFLGKCGEIYMDCLAVWVLINLLVHLGALQGSCSYTPFLSKWYNYSAD